MDEKLQKDILPESFYQFQKKLSKVNVLNYYQLKNSCIDILNSIHLEICVKSLFLEIISYRASYERIPNFQIPVEDIFKIPVEDIFQKIQFDFDIETIYRDFIFKPSILSAIDDYLNDIENVKSLFILSIPNYFWFVTFPNLFGSFLSSESCIDAKNFIKLIFKITFDESLADQKSTSKDIYATYASSAVISFISHNYFFYNSFEKTFFCELIYNMHKNKQQSSDVLDFEIILVSLKNALKISASTFNQHQIQILHLYFNTKFQLIHWNKNYEFQYQEILDKIILPSIKRWERSPYFQGNKSLYTKGEASIYQQLKDYLCNKPMEVIKLIQPFIDVINEQSLPNDDDFLVPYSLFSHKTSKVLTNLDIVILKGIHDRLNKVQNTTKLIDLFKNKSKLMFFYKVIKCNSESVSQPNLLFDKQVKEYNDGKIFQDSLIGEIKSNSFSERYMAQWLKLKERIKYGSDYDEIIKFYANILLQFDYYHDDDKSEEEEQNNNNIFTEIIDTFIKLADIDHENDIKTKELIQKYFKNFAYMIKMNSNILDEILVQYSSLWISSIRIPSNKTKDSINEIIPKSFISTLQDFWTEYKDYDEDLNDDNSNTDCIDLSNAGDNSEFDFLNLLIKDSIPISKDEKTQKTDIKEKELENDKKELENDEYRSEKESANIYYSLLVKRKKLSDENKILEIQRSIKHLYKFYIDYIKRGLLLADTKSEEINLMSDDEFKSTYDLNLDGLFLQSKKTVFTDQKFNLILEGTLPFFSYLLRPIIYDIEENNNKIEICLATFENTAYLINKMLNQFPIPETCRQQSSFVILSAIKYMIKLPFEVRILKERIKKENEKGKNIEQENDKKGEEEPSKDEDKSKIEQEILSFCDHKLMSFYKILVNQNACKNYPELQKLRTCFFYESTKQ